MKKWKKWNHSKTMIFTVVLAHPAIRFQHHFRPWITKNMDLETVFHLDIPNHRKSQKGVQSRSQEDPQMHPKIDKNWHLDLSVSIGCPPGPQDHQNGPQDHQNGVPGTKNGASRSPKWRFLIKKWLISAVNQPTSQPVNKSTSQPVNQSTSQPVNQLTS